MEHFSDILRSHFKNQPKREAIVVIANDGTTVSRTYEEVWNDMKLSTEKFSKGQFKIIEGKMEYNNIINYLSCINAGGVPAFFTPLTSRQDPELYRIEKSILTARYDKINKQDLKINNSNAEIDGFIQFTSGTTGIKKGVYIPLSKLLNQLKILGSALDIEKNDIVVSWLPLYHDMGLISSLFLPLYFGIKVVYLDPVNWSYRPLILHEIIEREKATLCWQPNFAFRHITAHHKKRPSKSKLSTLRKMISCSEPCRHIAFAEYLDSFSGNGLAPDALQTSYALAENVFAVTLSSFQGPQDWKVNNGYLSSGKIIPGNMLFLKETINNESEILISGDCVVNGYIGLTSEKFLNDTRVPTFKTGDIGTIIDDEIYVFARTDDILNINGRKIYAHELEEFVGNFDNVKSGRVLVTNIESSASLAVYYEGYLSAEDIQKIKIWTSSMLLVSISNFYELESGFLVKTSSGKISRKKCLEKIKAS